MRHTSVCSLLIVTSVVLGCGSNSEPRLAGTYVLDREATKAFLRSTAKGDNELAARLESIADQPMTVSYQAGRRTIDFAGVRDTREYRIVESGPNYLVTECSFTKKEAALGGKEVDRERIEFTSDGFWLGKADIPMERFKQKFVKKE